MNLRPGAAKIDLTMPVNVKHDNPAFYITCCFGRVTSLKSVFESALYFFYHLYLHIISLHYFLHFS